MPRDPRLESSDPLPGQPSTKIDALGKIVGLGLSALFLVFVMYLYLTGRLTSPTNTERGVFFAVLIILGGPVPYFYVNMATKFNVQTPVGKISLFGGYAVAVFAAVFAVFLIPGDEKIRKLSLDNLARDIHSKDIKVQILGSHRDLLCVPSGDNKEPYVIYCNFLSSSVKSARVKITFLENPQQRPKTIEREISWKGPVFADLNLE